MKSVRSAIRWWIFLPFAPIFVALLSLYWGEVFYYLGLSRLQKAAEGVFLLDLFALLPYATLDFVKFGPEKNSSLAWILTRLSFFATSACLFFYGVTLIVQVLDRNFGHPAWLRTISWRHICVNHDVMTAGAVISAALGVLNLLLWLAESVRGGSALAQGLFAAIGAFLLLCATFAALFGRRWAHESSNQSMQLTAGGQENLHMTDSRKKIAAKLGDASGG